MSTIKDALGRGLESLIPKTNLSIGQSVVNLDTHKIIPNARQPRTFFTPEALDDLAASIDEQGVIQPIIVRRKGEIYEIVAGERRWRAAQVAGLSSVPAIIRDVVDNESLQLALTENIQREDLNPLDEAMAYDELVREFGLTHEDIAKKIGKSRVAVTNSIRLLTLDQACKDSIRQGKISAGHARAILQITSAKDRSMLLAKIIKYKYSVRQAEYLANRIVSGVSRGTKRKIEQSIRDVEDDLAQTMGTKVILNGTTKKGKIEIHYFSEEDLDRIIKKLTQSAISPGKNG